MSQRERFHNRMIRRSGPSLRNWGQLPGQYEGQTLKLNSQVDCGWGRLLFAHTFESPELVAETLKQEEPGRRDIAIYLRDPHVVLAQAPQALFLDPSHTFRLWLPEYRPSHRPPTGFQITPVQSEDDLEAVNRIYGARGMVMIDKGFMEANRRSRHLIYLVARDDVDGRIIGIVMGVDHVKAFDDPENGCSLWALAVDPQTSRPGVGEALTRRLAERFKGRGRSFMDLSVMYDNMSAIALYEKLGFQRVPVFTVKTRNAHNEALYSTGDPAEGLNIYARILVEEAVRRGIGVEVLDGKGGYFRLSHGGRAVTCRESLTELTTAIAMSRCDDKEVTRRLMERAGIRVPAQMVAGRPEDNAAFLERHGRVVVKPARGEQGQGVAVDLRTGEELKAAIDAASRFCERVLIEEFVEGQDLRIIVINDEVVAAAIRRPAEVLGNGQDSIGTLIERQSRRRRSATGGESWIPLDEETRRCIEQEGYDLDSVLPANVTLAVRRTANLHTGGTIHDVTAKLSPVLAEAAVQAARALEIPVVGLDFLVPSPDAETYAMVEANERPGLANHEPQPTAERFIDLLFPQTRTQTYSA